MGVLLSIGEAMIEIADIGNGLLKKGFAGDTFNTAYYARTVLDDHWSVDYFTAIGDDTASAELADFMASVGVGTGHVRRLAGFSPGLYMIHLNNGERSFSYWRSTSAARQLASDIANLAAAIAGAKLVYFSGITLAILPAADRRNFLKEIGKAKAAGKIVAFDPNIRPRLWQSGDEMRQSIMDGAKVSTIALPGLDDEKAHFGDEDGAATIARYRSAGVRDVVLKDGADGVTLSLDGATSHVEAEKIDTVVDTTSAGDSFNGAYLARILMGDQPAEAARFAARLAARVISHPGAIVEKSLLL